MLDTYILVVIICICEIDNAMGEKDMNKREKIKYLVKEFALSFGRGSSEWKEIYIKQDSIVNKIDRNWRVEMVNEKYFNYRCGDEKIGSVMNKLMG